MTTSEIIAIGALIVSLLSFFGSFYSIIQSYRANKKIETLSMERIKGECAFNLAKTEYFTDELDKYAQDINQIIKDFPAKLSDKVQEAVNSYDNLKYNGDHYKKLTIKLREKMLEQETKQELKELQNMLNYIVTINIQLDNILNNYKRNLDTLRELRLKIVKA